MTFDWQNIVALMIVALAVAGIVLRAVATFKAPSACGGCNGCSSSKPLVQLSQTPSSRN